MLLIKILFIHFLQLHIELILWIIKAWRDHSEIDIFKTYFSGQLKKEILPLHSEIITFL